MNIYLCVLLSISSWFFSVRVSTIADPLVLRAMDDSVSVLARAMCPAICAEALFLSWFGSIPWLFIIAFPCVSLVPPFHWSCCSSFSCCVCFDSRSPGCELFLQCFRSVPRGCSSHEARPCCLFRSFQSQKQWKPLAARYFVPFLYVPKFNFVPRYTDGQ